MEIEDLLVYIDNSKACPARLDAAIRVTQAHGTHLTGLYVLPRLNIPMYTEVQIPQDILATQREAARTQAADAEKAIKAATDRSDVAAEWRYVEDDIARALTLHARYADLVVAGQADKSGSIAFNDGLAEKLVLASGRPVLVIPYIGAPEKIGERVLVAWNASREAVRAVHDALPMLKRAKTAHVLAINPLEGADGEGAIPSADICRHLARHGVKAEAHHVHAHNVEVGDMLLSRAADWGVDLIVMGAYGHSRLRELVLGGATRHLLQHMTVPVFMAH